MKLNKEIIAEIKEKVNKSVEWFNNPSHSQKTESFSTMDIFNEVVVTFQEIMENSGENAEYLAFMEKIVGILEQESP